MGCNFKKKNVFLSLNLDYVLDNNGDPDEKSRYAVFHLSLHCFLMYTYGVSGLQIV